MTYKQVIFDQIYGHCWKETIKEEIQNLENHHI